MRGSTLKASGSHLDLRRAPYVVYGVNVVRYFQVCFVYYIGCNCKSSCSCNLTTMCSVSYVGCVNILTWCPSHCFTLFHTVSGIHAVAPDDFTSMSSTADTAGTLPYLWPVSPRVVRTMQNHGQGCDLSRAPCVVYGVNVVRYL